MLPTCRQVLTVVGLAAALAGCGGSVTAAPPTSGVATPTVRITNCGQVADYTVGHQRIVALEPGQADLLARLGVPNLVVGVAQTDGRPVPATVTAGGRSVPVLSEIGPPSRERLLSVRPDLVLSPTTYEFTGEKGYATREQLTQAGVRTYVAAAGCSARRSTAEVTDLLTDIDAYGRILGRSEDAARLRSTATAQLAAAAARATGHPAPTMAQVFIEGDTITAIGAGVEHSIGAAAGGRSVFGPMDPVFAKFFAAEVSRETLLAKDPDVIVFSARDVAHEKKTRAWLAEHLAEMKAVRTGRLVAVPSQNLLPGTWGNIEAVTTINKTLFPGR